MRVLNEVLGRDEQQRLFTQRHLGGLGDMLASATPVAAAALRQQFLDPLLQMLQAHEQQRVPELDAVTDALNGALEVLTRVWHAAPPQQSGLNRALSFASDEAGSDAFWTGPTYDADDATKVRAPHPDDSDTPPSLLPFSPILSAPPPTSHQSRHGACRRPRRC